MANDEQEKKRKEEEKKKKEKKQRAKKMKIMLMVAKILIIVLLVVLVAGALFAIIEAILKFIIDIVSKLVTALITFFKDPLAVLERGWAKFKNWINQDKEDPEFNPTEFEQLRTDAVVTISDDKVQEMIQKMEGQINRETAGLDDVMLKKLVLAYYRGLYLDDTHILVEITAKDLGITADDWNNMFRTQAYKRKVPGEEEDWNSGDEEEDFVLESDEYGEVKIYKDKEDGPYKGQKFWPGIVKEDDELDKFKEHFKVGGTWHPNRKVRYILTDEAKTFLQGFGEQVYPFKIIEGEPDYLLGDDGHLYIKATGMVQMYIEPNSLKTDAGGYLCTGCNGANIAENCEFETDDNPNTTCYYKLKHFNNTIPEDADTDEDEGLIDLNDLLHSEATIDEKKYYKDEERPFLKLYKYYLYHHNKSDHKEFSEEVYKYLATCYTYNEDQDKIIMGSERTEDKTEKIWQFLVAGPERTLERTNSKSEKLQSIAYQEMIAQYANPVTFMAALMEHTGGRDFINSFIEKTANETYIKMRLYATGSEDETFEKVEKTRETTVEIPGEKADPEVEIIGVYQYKQKVGGYTGLPPSYEWTAVSVDHINDKVTATINSDGKTAKVTVTLTNVIAGRDTRVTVKFCGTEREIKGVPTSEKIIEGNLEIPDSWPNNSYVFKNTSNIIEYTKTTRKVSKYEIAIKKLKTWYASKTAENIEFYEFHINFETPAADGTTEYKDLVTPVVFEEEEVNQYLEGIFNDKDNPTVVNWGGTPYDLIVNKGNEKYIWEGTKQIRNPDTDNEETPIDAGVFEYNPSVILKFTNLSEKDCLNLQYIITTHYDESNNLRTLTEKENAAIQGNTVNKKMTAVDTNIKTIKYTKNYKKELVKGDIEGIGTDTTDYNTFLSLLSNETGAYDKNATYKPEDDGGKTVIYEDVYGGPSKPALLLINGEDQIDHLLRNTPTGDEEDPETLTELANAFKMMLYYYKNGNSSATSPGDLDYMGTEAFNNVSDDWYSCQNCGYDIGERALERIDACPDCGYSRAQFIKVEEISRVAVPLAA